MWVPVRILAILLPVELRDNTPGEAAQNGTLAGGRPGPSSWASALTSPSYWRNLKREPADGNPSSLSKHFAISQAPDALTRRGSMDRLRTELVSSLAIAQVPGSHTASYSLLC